MRRFWLWLIGIVAALAVAIVLVVVFFDWNWLKSPLEARLSTLTGKTVHIEGPLAGSWGRVARVSADQIKIEEPSEKQDAEVGTIGRVSVAIDLEHLFEGTLDLREIDIDRPVLGLVRFANGHANWDIANEASGPSHRGHMPLIGMLKIADGHVTYRDLGKHLEIVATIATIDANGGSGGEGVTLEGHGTYRSAPIVIRLEGGSLNDLRDTQKPYDLNISTAVGQTKISIAGTVLDPFKFTGMNVKLTAEGDNAEELYRLFGIPAPSTPPYHLVGMLDRSGGNWLFKNFSGTVGKSDLHGTLRFQPNQARLFVSGDLVSNRLDFADLGLLVGASGSTAPGRPVSETQKRLAREYEQSDRVLPNAPLNLDEVRSVDADVSFKGEHVETQNLPIEDADLHLKLNDAVLSLAPLHMGVAGGLIDATILINARGDPVETDYDVRFHRFQVDQFFQRAGFPKGATGYLDARAQLHGAGDSVRRSLGSSNGEVSAIVDQGTISNLASDILGLDVMRALGFLFSGEDKQIPLNCFVTDLQVRNGVMSPRIFVLDTEATRVTASGNISLADERLDLSINGEPKKPSALHLGGPIEIGGTFKHPSAGLGAEAVARGGAAVALGALLTPLAAVIGFLEPGEDKQTHCAALEQEAQSGTSKAPPAPPPQRQPPKKTSKNR